MNSAKKNSGGRRPGPLVLLCAGLLLSAVHSEAAGGIWTTAASMPTAREGLAAAVVDGKIYAMGGFEAEYRAVPTVEVYDPLTDTWTRRADMPTARGSLAAATVDGRIYAIGGWDGGTDWNSPESKLATVEMYDPETDTWVKKADMGQARCLQPVAAVHGQIYAIGGQLTGNDCLSTVEAYNPETDTWTPTASMPGSLGDMPAAVVDGRIYVLGGFDPRASAQVIAYDPGADTWTEKAPKPTGQYGMARAVIDGRIYLFGGGEPMGGVSQEAQVYDPATDAWTVEDDMPGKRYAAAAAAIDGRIFLLGGSTGDGAPLSTVDVMEPARPELLEAVPTSLSALAGLPADLPIELTLTDPLEDGTYPRLQLDLSELGEESPADLVHQGNGRYAVRLYVTPEANGQFHLPVRAAAPGALARYLCSIVVQVWPAQSLSILAEDLAPGWDTTTRSIEQLALAQTDVVCTGSTACALHTKSSFSGWTVVLAPAQPIAPFGYESLRLAVHPGNLALGENDRLQLSLGGGRKPVDLLDGTWVDWGRAEWQRIDIPLARLEAEGPITGVTLTGTPVGTLYLDDLALVAQKAPAPTAVVESRTTAIPQTLSLRQNYPNPFNSGTALRFALPEATQVELAVFNPIGQQVAMLVHGMREAGAYSVAWDGIDDQGRPLATGVYLYRLRAGAQTETRRLLLLR